MNLTDFSDSALLKLDIGGPFGAQVVNEQTEEYIVVQISQNEDIGSRRRRQQQVIVFKLSFTFSEVCLSLISITTVWIKWPYFFLLQSVSISALENFL